MTETNEDLKKQFKKVYEFKEMVRFVADKNGVIPSKKILNSIGLFFGWDKTIENTTINNMDDCNEYEFIKHEHHYECKPKKDERQLRIEALENELRRLKELK